MVLEHIDSVSRVFDDIRGNLEEENSYATGDELVDYMRRQSREASTNILSEFMD
ncbi:hypothetical protein [Candidatus Ichthyocystis hellenicum]|uniref:hypothetical protein n=1 Tax=Candidatus Ichthyocystis hellenicum TaxID=1561003 RepID=UPI001584525F|nr:hypothetical protein [Candidatus Ichthyocystis hellenicum]